MEFATCLSKLTDADKQALSAQAETRPFKTGEVVIKEGDKIDELLIMQRGKLRVIHGSRQAAAGEFVGPLGPGNAVGEMSFLDGGGASATLIADGDAELLAVPKSVLDELVEKDPAFAGRLYLSLFLEISQKLRSTNLRVPPAVS